MRRLFCRILWVWFSRSRAMRFLMLSAARDSRSVWMPQPSSLVDTVSRRLISFCSRS